MKLLANQVAGYGVVACGAAAGYASDHLLRVDVLEIESVKGVHMAILKILQYPDERLHKVAKPVKQVNETTRKLVRDMAETMYAAPGVGLAATQVDVHERIIVIDASETHDRLKVFINPEIIASSGEEECEEGCLSVPGIYETVRRAARVTVRALDEKGETFTLEAEGLLAVCVQHEMDHLLGKVFVEYLSQLKQTRIRAKLKKRLRETM
jgi:peptide deformylase